MAKETVGGNAKVMKAKKGRSLEERLSLAGLEASLKPGEHPEDLVLYANATNIIQIITDDRGVRQSLLPPQYTEKSFQAFSKGEDASALVEFKGGTIILTRRRGQPLEAKGMLKELRVVDKADPSDYEAVEIPGTVE